MLDGLVQQFLGGGGESLMGQELHGGVGQMIDQAPNHQVNSAVGDALGNLGPEGLAQSVFQAAEHSTPQQRNGLADTLMQAVSRGGGSPSDVLSQLGIGGSQMGPGELAQLAQHVAGNHPGALSQVLGDALNQQGSGGGSGGGIMQLLGNPMVRQVGMQLAQKAFS